MQEPIEMLRSVELLGGIVDQHGAKQLAHWTEMHINTVYDYAHGRINAPLEFWQKLFTATGDVRILDALVRGRPMTFAFLSNVPDLSGDADALRASVDHIGQFHAHAKYLADIFADGRIDEADADAAKHLREECLKMINHAWALTSYVDNKLAAAATVGGTH